jgi:Rod binding domain-containing protein
MSSSSLPGLSASSNAAADAQGDLLLARAQSAAASGARDSAKIQKAGHDFESLLLGTWLTQAEQTFAQAPGGASEQDDDGEGGDGTGDQFLNMAMQHLASAITDSGGIGIARMITQHLGHEAPPAPEAKNEAKP